MVARLLCARYKPTASLTARNRAEVTTPPTHTSDHPILVSGKIIKSRVKITAPSPREKR